MILAKKKFEFRARVQKCHFGKNEKLPIARIGHGPCYYHWNEIFAGVCTDNQIQNSNDPNYVISLPARSDISKYLGN